jgi:hypothetical protein
MFKKALFVIGLCVALLFSSAAESFAYDLGFGISSYRYLDNGFMQLSFTWNTSGLGVQPGTFIAVESSYLIEQEPSGQLNYMSSGPVTRREFYGYKYQLHVYLRNYLNGRGAWYASSWITCGHYPPPLNPSVPVWDAQILERSLPQGSTVDLDWSVPAYVRIYEGQVSESPDFKNLVQQFWPSDSKETITGLKSGIYYFRVRSWNTIPGRQGALVSQWSQVLRITLGDFSAPVLSPISNPAGSAPIVFNWTDVPASRIYELVEYRDFNCTQSTGRNFWPQASEETISFNQGGTFYYRVRAWSAISGDYRVSTPWSNVISLSVEGFFPPVIQPIGSVTVWERMLVDWSDVSGAALYQLIEYSNTEGTVETGRQFWPSASFDSIQQQTPGNKYYRVRAWSAAPENGGVSSCLSDVVRGIVLTIPGSEITVNSPVPFNESAYIDWADIPGAAIYQLEEYRDEACLEPTGRQFWPSASFENVRYDRPALYFYRVRGWNETPSEWSRVVSVMALPDEPVLIAPSSPVHIGPCTMSWIDRNNLADVDYTIVASQIENGSVVKTFILAEDVSEKTSVVTVPEAGEYEVYVSARSLDRRTDSVMSDTVPLTVFDDAALLNDIKRRAFNYFMDTTFIETGLARDKFPRDLSGTVEIVGERDSDTVSTAACGFYLSVLTVGVQNGWIAESDARERALTTLRTFRDITPNHYGFFYHYLNPDGSPSAYPMYEVSTIDTALFIAGALQAGEFFGGDVKELSEEIYTRVEWTKLFNGYTHLFHMGWTPSGGSFGEYDAYSEAMLLYLLAIGSPTDPIPAETFYNFMRDKGEYQSGEKFIYNFFGQLFTYQFPHAWFDFNDKTDALGVNWYQNSQHAIRANEAYCREQGYEENYWGLSAALADPNHYPSGYAAFGALPADAHTADGTIAPYAVIASLPFESESAMNGIHYLAYALRETVWGEYGFVDSINSESTWSADSYLGIDQGLICLMIENAQTQGVWNSFMLSEHVFKALESARFSCFAEPFNIVESFEKNTFWNPESELGWWDIDGGYVYQFGTEYKRTHSGNQAMKITFNKQNRAWSLFAGYIAPTNEMRDISNKSKLCFWVSGEVELLVKLRDRTYAEVELGRVKTTTPAAWSYVEFDLTHISGINKEDIDNIMFFAAPGTEGVSGSFIIDSLVIE